MLGVSRPTFARGAAALLRVRWIVRAPVWLYRARLGFVFGSRFLMLEHLGRNSGARRYVVLEIIDHPSAGRYVVVSGFSSRAQWFRNVLTHPTVRVYLRGRRPRLARAHELDPNAAASALSRYAAAHPGSWAKLRPVLERTLGSSIDESDTELPLVALDLR